MKVKSNLNLLLLLIAVVASTAFYGCNKDKKENDPNPTSNWSGKLIHDSSSSIREYNFATKENPTILTGNMPARLANGSILHISGTYERLEMMSANGAQRTVIYDAKETTAVYSPQVSPDGTKIAFTHTKLFDPSKYPVKEGTVIIDLNGNYIAGIPDMYNAVWLPDGRLVVAGDFTYSAFHDTPSTPSDKAGLYIATLNGTTATLTNINTSLKNPTPLLPSVSPDGSKVAFILNQHLWTMNLDGSNLKQVTASDNDNEEGASVWSPDGKHIAVWSFKTFERTYYTAIAIIPSDPAEPIKLTNDAPIWPREKDDSRLSGGSGTLVWHQN